MFQVSDNYPGDAARGACYLTGASRGEIVTIDPETGEDRVRPEKVIVTPISIDFEGRLCFGERTVRHLAHLLGMVDSWRVERLRVAHDSLLTSALETAAELERVRAENDTLTQMVEKREQVFVATDGTAWPSRRSAAEASRRTSGLVPMGADALRSIGADEAPLPSREMV